MHYSPNMTTVIIYSGGSNTTAVSQYIAEKTGGKAVTVQEAAGLDLGSFDKIVVGTRVRAGKVPSDLSDFVAKNKAAIDAKDPSFFLCCMYKDDKGQKQLDKIASQLGFQKAVFFTKGKKIVKEAGNPVDSFISSL